MATGTMPAAAAALINSLLLAMVMQRAAGTSSVAATAASKATVADCVEPAAEGMQETGSQTGPCKKSLGEVYFFAESSMRQNLPVYVSAAALSSS